MAEATVFGHVTLHGRPAGGHKRFQTRDRARPDDWAMDCCLTLSTEQFGPTAGEVVPQQTSRRIESKADSSALEVSLLKQFVTWKDELLTAINGKYVSDELVGKIRTSLRPEMGMITACMDHLEERCDERPKDCLSLRAEISPMEKRK